MSEGSTPAENAADELIGQCILGLERCNDCHADHMPEGDEE